MRNFQLLNNADASISVTSQEVNLDKRTEWVLLIDLSNADGIPSIYIDQGFTGGKCIPNPSEWYVLANKCDSTGEFIIDDEQIQIKSNYFKGNWFRIRYEAKDNTAGTISVKLSYKDFP